MSNPATPTRSRRLLLLLALCVLAAAWFGTLGERKLTRPDEGRYAEISREMVASGDWLTPRLNGFKYFEKPALQYWATALAFEAFGMHEWSARLWPALTGFLALLWVGFIGRRILGPPVGLLAAAILAGSLLWAAFGQIDTLDMGVSFFMFLSVGAVLLAQDDAASPRARGLWMHAAWAAAALAVLSKGLIGIVLPAGAVVVYVLVERDWSRLRRLNFWSGAALFFAIAAPWFVAVSLANDEFFHFFFVHEHFERFLTKTHGRYQPFWYFVPVLLVGFSPWAVTLVPSLAAAWRDAPQRAFRPARFLLVWALLVFVFFSASDSKLAAYILPVFPALALLVAQYVTRAGRAVLVAQSAAYAAIGAAAALLAPHLVAGADPAIPAELWLAFGRWIAAAAWTFAACAAASALWALRSRRVPATIVLGAGGFACALMLVGGFETLSPAYSAYHLLEQARTRPERDVPVYSVDVFDHTLLYYLGRPVTMVGYRDELDRSIGWAERARDPAARRYLPDTAAFARAWRADRDAWAVFSVRQFPALPRSLGLAYEVVARDPRFVLVRKPPPEGGAATAR